MVLTKSDLASLSALLLKSSSASVMSAFACASIRTYPLIVSVVKDAERWASAAALDYLSSWANREYLRKHARAVLQGSFGSSSSSAALFTNHPRASTRR